MAEYHSKSIDSLHFEVAREAESLGTLIYKSWFSFDAKMELADDKKYQVQPKGFWGTTIEVKDQDMVILKFKMNWSGNIVIQTFFNAIETGYVFKHKGIFKDSYVLCDQEGVEQLVMKPQIKWSKLTYEYTITTSESFERLPKKEILILTSLHCANYYLAMIVSATGG